MCLELLTHNYIFVMILHSYTTYMSACRRICQEHVGEPPFWSAWRTMRSLITQAFSREAPPHCGRKLVLIIEPHPAISHLLRSSLELAGYAVMEQVGGATCFDHTRWMAHPPAAILLDLSLSWDGVADLALLHASWKDAPPILVLTTNQQLYAELAQTQRILLKPFHLHDLLLAVQQMIGSDAQECCHVPQQPGAGDAT